MSTSQPAKYTRLSVIVPIYNERNNIGEALRRMKVAPLPDGLELEVVVVDDGSTDGTDKVLAALEDSTVSVVKHPTNKGKGAAIRSGLKNSRGDVVIIQGAGLEYHTDDWQRLLAPIVEGRGRVVYGSRFQAERVTIPLTRLLIDRAVSIATCVLFNTTLTDVETGMKAFDRSLLVEIGLESDRFEVEPEITAKLLRRNERIFEVPITYAGRERGRNFSGRNGLHAVQTLLKSRFASLTGGR